jgi:hypothetical protein
MRTASYMRSHLNFHNIEPISHCQALSRNSISIRHQKRKRDPFLSMSHRRDCCSIKKVDRSSSRVINIHVALFRMQSVMLSIRRVALDNRAQQRNAMSPILEDESTKVSCLRRFPSHTTIGKHSDQSCLVIVTLSYRCHHLQ